MVKVFLGGTCNGSTWRDALIPQLSVDCFNPVVADWTPADLAEEIRLRETCDFLLYTFTPKMIGVYAVAEAVDDSNKRPHQTIICLLNADGGLTFAPPAQKSMAAVAQLVAENGARVFTSLEECAAFLNNAGATGK